MSKSPDRSPRALAALATALGITIGVAPHSLLAQGAGAPPPPHASDSAAKGSAAQLKLPQSGNARVGATQLKFSTPAAHATATQLKVTATQIKHTATQNKVTATQNKVTATQGKATQLKVDRAKATQLKMDGAKATQLKIDRAATTKPKQP